MLKQFSFRLFFFLFLQISWAQEQLDFEDYIRRFPHISEGFLLREEDFLAAWQEQPLEPEAVHFLALERRYIYPLAQYDTRKQQVLLLYIESDQPFVAAAEQSYAGVLRAKLYHRRKLQELNSEDFQARIELLRQFRIDSLGQGSWQKKTGTVFLQDARNLQLIQSKQDNEAIWEIEHRECLYKISRQGFELPNKSPRLLLDRLLSANFGFRQGE